MIRNVYNMVLRKEEFWLGSLMLTLGAILIALIWTARV